MVVASALGCATLAASGSGLLSRDGATLAASGNVYCRASHIEMKVRVALSPNLSKMIDVEKYNMSVLLFSLWVRCAPLPHKVKMWIICLVRMFRCKTVIIYPVAESPYWTDRSDHNQENSFSFTGLQYCLRV